MHAKMVEDVKGCNVVVNHLGIAKITNPRVVYNSLDKNLDATLSSLVGVVALKQGSSGSFGANTVDARRFCGDRWVITDRTGGWAYKGSAVMVKKAICTGNKAPQVVDAIDAVVRRIGKMAFERWTRLSLEGCPSMGRKSA
jgi:hypothetical protein